MNASTVWTLRLTASEVGEVKARVGALVTGLPVVLTSGTFPGSLALLRAAEVRGWRARYRDWRKVKTVAWREANRERWRLFER